MIIFSPVYSQGISRGSSFFLERNGNLFNVAITRARANLWVAGDLAACAGCEVDYLANFARYSQQVSERDAEDLMRASQDLGPVFPEVSNPESVSDWEKILYEALYDSGISTTPQFRVERYVQDLALIVGDRRLNIEVDGERYHRAWTGELCRRDQIRNQRMFELGWDVMRFWVYEIRDELPSCVERVKAWIDQGDRV